MLKDVAQKYYFAQNYNCAETILRAANEYYELGLSEKEMLLVAGFGGGMQTGNTCGTFLSAISILSLKYVEERAHESQDIKPVATLMTRRFKEEFGPSLMCKDIKPKYFSPEIRCKNTVDVACDIIEKVLAEYQPK